MITETDDGASDKTTYLQTLLGAFNSNFDLNLSDGVGDGDGVISSPVPSSRISSASAEGMCDCCGTRLEVVGLDIKERARVRSALKHLAMGGGGRMECATAAPPAEKAGKGGATTDIGSIGGRRKRKEGEGGGEGRGMQEAKGGLRQFAEWLEEKRREVRLQLIFRNTDRLGLSKFLATCLAFCLPLLFLSVRPSFHVCPSVRVGRSV